MLNDLLEKCFNEDEANSGFDVKKIKTNVLTRIEREKPMKHFGFKALIIAAAMMIGGVMSIVLSASASTDDRAVQDNSSVSNSTSVDVESDLYIDPNMVRRFGKEEAIKYAVEEKERQDIIDAYFEGKIAAAKENGGVVIEKELDETDVVGYVPPVNQRSQAMTFLKDEDLEYVKRIEEDPESLGLIPAGKSETFEGGYRIVNRHYINTNEPVDGRKIYYSFRRVYTDDSENRLIASSYFGVRLYYGSEKYNSSIDFYNIVLSAFLDHTEDGCLYDPSYEVAVNIPFGNIGGGEYGKSRTYDVYNLIPNPNANSNAVVVRLESAIYVTEDHIQLVD